RGRLHVVCGGTGLYISSLVQVTVFTKEKASPELRESLLQKLQQLGAPALLEELAQKDPAYAAALHPADEKRIVRGLEQLLLTGKTYAQRAALSRPQKAPYRALCLGIEYPREILYARIEQRVEHMLQNGLLQEAQLVYNNRTTFKTAAQAIGYKEFFPYFDGQAPLAECLQKLKQATRNYAKRQLTWFKHMPEVVWLNGEESALPKAEEQLRNFLA
ncbi:MAG: tRNA (adenosine(37)-N6)-dimethylallyltransferase MiaA, partial [Oscillospiraceae bacterium]